MDFCFFKNDCYFCSFYYSFFFSKSYVFLNDYLCYSRCYFCLFNLCESFSSYCVLNCQAEPMNLILHCCLKIDWENLTFPWLASFALYSVFSLIYSFVQNSKSSWFLECSSFVASPCTSHQQRFFSSVMRVISLIFSLALKKISFILHLPHFIPV